MKNLLVLACCFAANAFAFNISPMIINGKPVTKGDKQAIVSLKVNSSMCSATIVGPRVLVTAGHCAKSGEKASFEFQGKQYSGIATRHPLYSQQDVDVSLVLTKKEIKGVSPLSIGGAAAKGQSVQLFGLGCASTSAPIDRTLRFGNSEITGFLNNDIVMEMVDGAAFCFGDSGGPVLVEDGNDQVVLAIASKGDIAKKNYGSRLDSPAAQTFLMDFVKYNAVDICGINTNCL